MEVNMYMHEDGTANGTSQCMFWPSVEVVEGKMLYVCMYVCMYVCIRHHGSDVYLGMSPIQNGGSYLMHWRTLVKVVKRSQTGTIQGHG